VQRVTRELQRRGVPVGRRVVARLMRALGMAGVTRRKRRNLTKPDNGASAVPDLNARTYRIALGRLEIRLSASRSGSCLDGAVAEAFFATIRTGIGVDSRPDRVTARCDVEGWIKAYNERRMHSSLGYETPTTARISWQQHISTAL
jgi:transposase InsO family protein